MSLDLKVYIIDDLESMRKIIKYNLLHIGFKNIDDCEYPIQALQKIKKAFHQGCPYQLLICDLTMPKLSGIELVQQLRQDDNFRSLPILMVISNSDRKDAEKIISQGANALIIKPFSKEQLKEKIDKIMTNY